MKSQDDDGDRASKWVQRLLLSTGFVFFLGGLLVVAGGPGVVPFLTDSGTSSTVGGPVGATPTPDDHAGGTPTANGTGNESGTPAGNGDGRTPTNGSDGTPMRESGENGTATPTPTPEPIIGIG